MLQDPISKPPDVQLDGASRPPTDRRQKTNANPDQVLKCPRCDSMNTKFCYYNNYSLTQPRHFCKNCRRYWTQGGSLRNVPIGGGCRKNKRVKQRTVDPHSFVSLDESATNAMLAGLGPAGLGGPGGGLLPPGHFMPPPPTFGDLVPNNDSHLLSMAFSRLQESLRLGEQAAQNAGGHHLLGPNPGKLSLMSGCSMPYDSPALAYNNHGGPPHPGHVKAEHGGGVIYSGSDLGSLFDPSQLHLAGAGPPPPGSATATLASLEEQLTSFGPSHVDAFNIESQLKLQQHQQQQNHKQQQQLALHLGGGGAEHMQQQQQHHPNMAEFEEHENSEVMQMRRQQAAQAAAAAHGAAKAGKMMMGIDWGAAGGGATGASNGPTGENLYVQQEQNHGGSAPGSNSDHQNGASASFWNHSPWTDVHTLTSSSLMN